MIENMPLYKAWLAYLTGQGVAEQVAKSIAESKQRRGLPVPTVA